jgi:hypothetical protein
MTLVLTFFSDQYVVLASDRRVTWFDQEGIPRRREDTENKAIVLCGHFLMGYTGFARLDDKKTEQWVAETLAGIEPSQYFSLLVERAGTAVARIRQAHKVRMEASGHAFVAVGYGSFRRAPDRLEACGITVSNALDESYGSWQPRQAFSATRTPLLSSTTDFRLGAFGAPPSHAALSDAVDLIRRYRKRDLSRALGVCQIMVNLIRATAQGNPKPASQHLMSQFLSKELEIQ